jgi:ribosomal protein L31E
MFFVKLHDLYKNVKDPKVSFIGFEISKTVWSNQINIIPVSMKIMATIMKYFGTFISIEKCGMIMAPLFTENQEESLKKSGKFVTWKNNEFKGMKEEETVFNQKMQERLWEIGLELCRDEKTTKIANSLQSRAK